MANYLEGLCVFICLGDLMAHFMSSEKFLKLYRHIAGVLILLLLLEPFGKELSKEIDGQGSLYELEKRLSGQEVLWSKESGREVLEKETEKTTQAYLGDLTDEKLRERLEDYGYEIEETEGNTEKTDYGREGE